MTTVELLICSNEKDNRVCLVSSITFDWFSKGYPLKSKNCLHTSNQPKTIRIAHKRNYITAIAQVIEKHRFYMRLETTVLYKSYNIKIVGGNSTNNFKI